MGIATSQHLVGNPGRSGSVFIEPFRPRHAVPQKSGCADKLAHRHDRAGRDKLDHRHIRKSLDRLKAWGALDEIFDRI